MKELLTTDDVAISVGLSYDYTRKLLRDWGFKPVQVLGRNKLYSQTQAAQLGEMLSSQS